MAPKAQPKAAPAAANKSAGKQPAKQPAKAPAKAAPAPAAAKPAEKPAAAKPAEKPAAAAKKTAAATSNTGVYVKGLGNAGSDVAKAFFEKAGKITDFRIRRNKYAIFWYDNSASVKKAVETLNNKDFNGAKLAVSAAKAAPKPDEHQGSKVVFASPLFRESTTRKQIFALFGSCGKIVKLRTYHNNTAFIYFDSAAAAQKAIKDKNGSQYQNKTLVVKESVRSIDRDNKKEAQRRALIAARRAAAAAAQKK